MGRIFGIDLGTTNSLIAAMENGEPRVIAVGENGSALLPSVVAIAPDGSVTVGERAISPVPESVTAGERQAPTDSAPLAGLEVVRLVSGPTAASLAYGLNKMATGNVAVFDFGGGTFDISILSIKEGIFEVLATNGDTHLGGDDIDRAIVDWLLGELAESIKLDRHVWNSARMAAEDAKTRLTDLFETEIVIELPGHTIRKNLTRDNLE